MGDKRKVQKFEKVIDFKSKMSSMMLAVDLASSVTSVHCF